MLLAFFCASRCGIGLYIRAMSLGKENKQRRYDLAYLRMAREWAKLSHCVRKQVGALIVRDNMIVADGYNGTPSGFSNACENDGGETHWYVLHAEANVFIMYDAYIVYIVHNVNTLCSVCYV